jgi:hypothetical protein
MKKGISIFAIFILGLLLLACASSDETQLDVDAVRTQAVETYASSLTETLVALPVHSPTVTSLPSFTPRPVTETPTVDAAVQAQNSCYNLIFIKDVTIPDGTQLKPNETFTKTWLVQNNGGCAWGPGFTLVHVGGDSMRGQTLVLRDPIPVGAKRELSIEMAVPSGQTGLIQSSWQMADSNGIFFGDTLTVNIQVGNITTPVVTVTP